MELPDIAVNWFIWAMNVLSTPKKSCDISDEFSSVVSLERHHHDDFDTSYPPTQLLSHEKTKSLIS